MAAPRPTPVDQVLYALLLRRRTAAVADGKTAQSEVLGYVVPAIEKRAVRLDGGITYLAKFWAGAMLPDGKAAKTGTASKGTAAQYTFFNLTGFHRLHYPGAPLFKHLGDFTLFDGDQFERQKEANYHAAGAVLEKYRWEWGLIRPVLVEHPDWLYRDAYAHLLTTGGIPTLPEFEKPKRRKTTVAKTATLNQGDQP